MSQDYSIELSQENATESPFDQIKRIDENGIEYWLARELQITLGYTKWQHFNKNVQKAKISCENSGNLVREHILPRSVILNSSAKKPGLDYKLSRYACYLVAMNGDPLKPEIASAQSYFAIKTREAETVIPAQSDRIKELELILAIEKERNDCSKFRNALVQMHGASLALALLGNENVLVKEEIKTTEVVNPATKRCDNILTAEQLKEYVQRKTGTKIRSMKELTERLKKLGRDDLLVAVTRNSVNEYILAEKIDEAIALLFERNQIGRQLKIGEIR